jgi:cullin-associated NEDD8-dissociated protein 1
MQTQHAETVRADAISSSGILGRISEQLSLKRLKASCYSVSGKQSNALEEPPGLADSQIIIDPKSEVSKLDKYQISDIDLHNITLNSTSVIYESIFADTWNEVLNKGLKNMAQLEYIMRDSSIPKPLESKQMDFIARTIASRAKLNSTVDMFDYRMGGFDTHSSFGFVYNMKVLNLELQEFVTEIKRQGVWDNVLIVMASEFGRTLRSNRKGTDHGWGGNTFIMGGSVRGGQILGKFPSRFDDPDLHIGNGILIPTTPWEGMWNGIAQWAGVDDNALDKVLPNRKNFLNGDYLFTKDRMFKK